MSDGSSQTAATGATRNARSPQRLIRQPGASVGLLAGMAGAAVALAFGELMDGLFDSIPSLVVAVGEALVDYSPDWAVKLSIELFGEKDKAVLAIGIVGVALVIGGLLGTTAMWQRSHRAPLAGFAAFALIGGWTAARNPMSPFIGSWIVALCAAALGAGTLLLLLRLAPHARAAAKSATSATTTAASPDEPDAGPPGESTRP